MSLVDDDSNRCDGTTSWLQSAWQTFSSTSLLCRRWTPASHIGDQDHDGSQAPVEALCKTRQGSPDRIAKAFLSATSTPDAVCNFANRPKSHSQYTGFDHVIPDCHRVPVSHHDMIQLPACGCGQQRGRAQTEHRAVLCLCQEYLAVVTSASGRDDMADVIVSVSGKLQDLNDRSDAIRCCEPETLIYLLPTNKAKCLSSIRNSRCDPAKRIASGIIV
jgi:hypothetical protein